MATARGQPAESKGRIAGEVILVPVLEAPGQKRVGRFGWKNQHSSLLSFVGDAYLNEMGVTNRLRPNDSTSVCKTTADIEDKPRNCPAAPGRSAPSGCECPACSTAADIPG